MIQLFNNPFHEIKFKTTIFPDKTSQIWQIEPFEKGFIRLFIIEWTFESESELMHVLQLATLLKHDYSDYNITLSMPYLPYARQDKNVTNNSTFALSVFKDVLLKSDLFDSIHVEDVHNPSSVPEFINNMYATNEMIKNIIIDKYVDIICFPDKGATLRNYDIQNLPSITLEKKRNAFTGEIEGLQFNDENHINLSGKTILIADDLGDGMRTFIEATKLLKSNGANKVCVYTTHGLYTKGTKICFDAGIDKIFNLNGEVIDNGIDSIYNINGK